MFKNFIVINLVVLILTVSGSSQSKVQNQQSAAIKNKTAAELVSEGKTAYRNKDYAKSAQAYQQAIAEGAKEPVVFYDAACSTAQAGDKEKAFQHLFKAIKAGYRNISNLEKDSDLLSLHDDARWEKVLAACREELAKFNKEHRDPNKARFITTDISRFWKAYDKALAAAPAERAAIFQKEYIEPSTVGLKDFAGSGRLDAKNLTRKIESSPNFFKSIRPVTENIDGQRAETILAFRKLKEFYPQAIFPDAYFVIGQLGSGGTASSNGLLIGTEMFTRSSSVPVNELNDWEKGALMEPNEIPALVAHEFVHFQQSYPADRSLLCSVLKEGSADFIGELMSGKLITRMHETHGWADAREAQLWEDFQKEMNGTDISHWLYGSSGGLNRPVDLGYWMGYKISEAYYKITLDKKQAVKDILQVKDCREFLTASRYGEKFASKSR